MRVVLFKITLLGGGVLVLEIGLGGWYNLEDAEEGGEEGRERSRLLADTGARGREREGALVRRRDRLS